MLRFSRPGAHALNTCPCALGSAPSNTATPLPAGAWSQNRVARHGKTTGWRARPRTCAASARRRRSLAAASQASAAEACTAEGGGGGGDVLSDGGGGGRGGGSEGPALGAGRALEASAEDVVLLDVRGMHCGGCSARVGRLLEAQPHVAGASVSLATEVALVRVRLPPELAGSTESECLLRPAASPALPSLATQRQAVLSLLASKASCA